MKGLMKNSYYGASGSAFILLFIFLAVGAAMLVFKIHEMLNIFALITFTAFPCCAFSSFRKEAACKWNKYELTTPVRRKDIVKSRYLSHTLWTLAAAVLCAVYIGISVLICGNKFFYDFTRDPIALFTLSGLSLFVGAFYFPIVYALGADKSEVVLIISIIAAAGTTFGIIWLLNLGIDGTLSNFEYYLRLAIYEAIAILTFILSYYLTAFIYNRKEY